MNLLATLVLPGSVQVARGNRRVGFWAMAAWGCCQAITALAIVVALTNRGVLVGVLANGSFLTAIAPAVLVLGIGETLLLLDAWRLSFHGQSFRGQLSAKDRRGLAAVASLVAVGMLAGTLSASAAVHAQGDMWSTVLGGGGDSRAHDGRLNILLLGGDAGSGRDGMRPDSITVASIDDQTGRTVLFSLPRNLEGAVFPPTSPLHALYPNGYDCPDHSCMLNAVYTLGVQHKDLYPGVADPGVQATKEAVEGTLGLKINYYAMIDLLGFQTLVDAVGGINLDITKRVPMAGHSQQATQFIEPGKNVHLNGYQTLWFVRSRNGSTDYERMIRQKCVMNAMLKQLNPQTVLTNFTDLSKAGKQIVRTDIASSDANRLMELARKAKTLPIASVSFTPPLIYPGNPKIDLVHAAVKAAIQRAEDLDAGKKPATTKAAPATTSKVTAAPVAPKTSASHSPAVPSASDDNGTPQPRADDLTAVCSVP